MNKKIVFASTLADPRIRAVLSKTYDLFGRTSSTQSSGIPKLIYRNKWLVPETDSAEELIKVIDELMVKDS